MAPGHGVRGLGSRFQGLGYRAGIRSGDVVKTHGAGPGLLGLRNWSLGIGFKGQGSGFKVYGLHFRVEDFGFRVQGLGFRVQGLGFRV